jgi:branched-chain amino acid transport system substrate-binding protein
MGPGAWRSPANRVGAVISRSGEVTELHSAAGARLVRATPELARHAVGFLEAGLLEARFVWNLSGRTWLCATLRRRERHETAMAEAELTGSVEPSPHGLTRRELEVLTLVAAGLTNREVARLLVTSPRTISSHVAHILKKLRLPTRTAAAAVAVEQGLLVLPFPGLQDDSCPRSDIGVALIASVVRGDPAAPNRASRPRRFRPAPILVGSVFPAHGPADADGVEMRNGSSLAIREANARGGIRGRPIQHLTVDANISDPVAAKAAVQALIENEVDAITTGYFFSGSAILESVAGYGAPFLHGQTAESYVDFVRQDPSRNGNIFQVCPSETHYGVGFLRFLSKLCATDAWLPASRDIVLIQTAVSGGAIATPATLEYAEREDWKIANVIEIPPSSVDWTEVVDEVHKVDPAAIMVASFVPEELASFQRAFVDEPTDALVYAIYAPSIPSFLQHAGRAAEGLLWSTVSGTYGDAIGRTFAARYQHAFSRKPGRGHAGIAYDEIQLLLRAWAEVDNPRDFGQVAARLRGNTHRGVNGSYCFDTQGQCGLSYPDAVLDPSLGQAHLVLQVRDGSHQVLDPAPYIEGEFTPPPWCARTPARG